MDQFYLMIFDAARILLGFAFLQRAWEIRATSHVLENLFTIFVPFYSDPVPLHNHHLSSLVCVK